MNVRAKEVLKNVAINSSLLVGDRFGIFDDMLIVPNIKLGLVNYFLVGW